MDEKRESKSLVIAIVAIVAIVAIIVLVMNGIASTDTNENIYGNIITDGIPNPTLIENQPSKLTGDAVVNFVNNYVSCKDSDNGKNFKVYGELTVVRSDGKLYVVKDECYLNRYMIEKYCEISGRPSIKSFDCGINKCQQGRCV